MKKMTFIQAGLFAVLLGGAPFVLAGGANIDDGDCVNLWNQSRASKTCTPRSIENRSGEDCTVVADCKKTIIQGWRYTYGTIHATETDDLINCDGHIRTLSDSLNHKGCLH